MAELDALDQTLRRGLRDATHSVPAGGPDEPGALGDRLSARRTRRHRRRLAGRVAVASLAALAVLVTVVAWPSSEDGTFVDVGPDRSVPAGLLGEFLGRVAPRDPDRLEPGWHRIDSSPLPEAGPVNLAWTGEQLLVAQPGGLFGFHPPSGTWTELEGPPIAHPAYQLVAHDDAVYAIESNADGGASARLSLVTGRWEPLGDTVRADALTAAGTWGPWVPGGLVGAVSTGDRLFDLKHGAVLDPGSSQWRILPFPDDLDPRMLNGTPVWTGDEVVLLTSTDGGGLAWNADGTSVRRIPGPLTGPEDGPRSPFPGAAALAVEDGVVVLDPDGGAALLDPRSGSTVEAFPPSPVGGAGCTGRLVLAGDTPLVTSCRGSAALDLATGRWAPAASDALPEEANTIGTTQAAFAWSPLSVGPDTAPPYDGGAVWIPPRADEVLPAPDTTDPTTTGAVDLSALPPGWHEIETPVPATEGVASWSGERLVVGGGSELHVFDPATGEWTEHDPPPFDGTLGFTFAARGDLVVAVESSTAGVGTSGAASAALDLTTGSWTDLGPVPLASELAAAGATGPGGQASLVWAEDHLFDLRYGAVLGGSDLEAGWRPIPFPDDVVPYTGLLYTNPVWDGREVVLVSWSTQPGLAWNANGTAFREVPGMPASVHRRPGFNGDTAAVRSGQEVVVVTDDGLAAALDPGAGTWRALPTIPDMPTSEGCPDHLATARSLVVVSTCLDGGVVVQSADGWTGAAPPPPLARAGRWLSTEEAVLVWAASIDTLNDPAAPYSALHAFVPPP